MANGLHECTETRKVSGIMFKSTLRGSKNLEYSGGDSIKTRDLGFFMSLLEYLVRDGQRIDRGKE
jgi:hypothetical protein